MVFASQTGASNQEAVVSGKNTVVFVLETSEFAAQSVFEGSRPLVSAACTGVEAKNTMVFDLEIAVEEQ